MPQRRRRTLQGGTGRSATYGGTPNAQAYGITNQYLGRNPVPYQPMRTLPGLNRGAMNPYAGQLPAAGSMESKPRPGPDYRTDMFGDRPWPEGPEMPIRGPLPGPARGVNPNDFLGPDYSGERDPMAHQRFWANRGWTYRPNQEQFAWTGMGKPPGQVTHPDPGGFPGQGQGPGGEGPPGAQNFPLDPILEMQKQAFQNQLNQLLARYQGNYDVGLSQLNEQGVVGNQRIDSDMAARGLFGSGIERRSERLLGNDLTRGRMGLLQQLVEGQQSAQSNWQSQLLEAMAAAAARQAQDPYSAVAAY